MGKVKKWLATGLIFVLAAALVAGCGKSKTTGGSASDDPIKKIEDRGKLVVGVKYDTYLFGYKDPKTGKVEGFDVDIAKAISKKIFGDKVKVELKEVTSKTRIPMLQNGDVDMVVATMTSRRTGKKWWTSRMFTLMPASRSL